MPLWWAGVSITGGTNQLLALGVRTKLDTSPLENIQGSQVRGVTGTQEVQFAQSKNTFRGAQPGERALLCLCFQSTGELRYMHLLIN